jgi:UDP-glucose 4-epimerase
MLVAEGIEVTVLDHRTGDDLPASVGFLHGDAIDYDIAATLDSRRIDAVFQLAGSGVVPQTLLRPLDDLRRNTATTLAVLESAKAAEHAPLVCFVSSAAVYGEGESMPMAEDHPLHPVSPYGISKLAAEKYVALYSHLYAIPAFSVRPFSLYGPRQTKLVVYDLLTRALDGESPLTVIGSADVSRDFVFIADAAAALVTLARSAPAAGEAYNIASGRPATLGELVATLLDVVGLTSGVRFTGQVRPGDPLHWDGDPARAAALGAVCATTLHDGLRLTAEWVSNGQSGKGIV